MRKVLEELYSMEIIHETWPFYIRLKVLEELYSMEMWGGLRVCETGPDGFRRTLQYGNQK